MSNFEKAIEVVLRNEGGLSNNKSDPGGITNHGISFRYLKSMGDKDGDGFLDGDIYRDGVVDSKDIIELSKEKAKDFYKEIWQKNKYWQINDQLIATKLFDLAINMGEGRANRLIQYAVNTILKDDIIVDGVIGPKSIKAINACHPALLMNALITKAEEYYRSLPQQNPKLSIFLKGWLNRLHRDTK